MNESERRRRAKEYFEKHATPVSPPSEEQQRYNERVWKIVRDYNRVIETASRTPSTSGIRY